jgi:hypothetical protein
MTGGGAGGVPSKTGLGRREADVGGGRNTQMLVFWYINLLYSYDLALICG